MQVLLCAATSFEIQPTIDMLKQKNTGAVTVLITGVGSMAATYALLKSISKDRPGLIVQAGVAGSLVEGAPKVVAVQEELTGDLGVEDGGSFRSLADLALLHPDHPPWENGRLRNEHSVLNSSGLPLVNGVTVNEITTNKGRMEYYRGLGAQIESMEGAALHYVALQGNIPFIQLRSISNVVGERNKSKWEMKAAITNLNSALQDLLAKILLP